MKNLDSLALRVVDGEIMILDQSVLPHDQIWHIVRSPIEMVEHIRALRVRGAPLIGVAAAVSLAKHFEQGVTGNAFLETAQLLRGARPTAVNLMHAVDRVLQAENPTVEAELIFEEDRRLCETIQTYGATLLNDGDSVLTHCNTGALVTTGEGTALGVIRAAHRAGKRIHVYVAETRPLMQGARLTAWECERFQIPYTLICDSMAASLMRSGRIQKVIVGADRVASNGDFANKIGTYSVAVLAKFHGIPFYVAAPWTTVDEHCESGASIPVEQRDPREVRRPAAPASAPVFNPAFDVTPAELVTAWITDRGIFQQSFALEPQSSVLARPKDEA